MSHRDLTGEKFGKLTAISIVSKNYYGCNWLCQCDCGQMTIVRSVRLRNGHTKSCGCLIKEATTKRNYIHGFTKTRLYRIWSLMKDRCTNSKTPSYKNYGGRGIIVCKEWLDFNVFRKWAISHGYSDNLSIDRVDNNGNYNPKNCRWADVITQQNNTRRNHYLTFNGKTLSIADWSRKTKIPRCTLWSRIKSGEEISSALTRKIEIHSGRNV